MNVFLACFLAVVFARVVIAVAQHQIASWWVKHHLKRAGKFRSSSGSGSGPTIVPPASIQAQFEEHARQHAAISAVIRTSVRVGELAHQVVNPTKPGVVIDLSLCSVEQDAALADLVEVSMTMLEVVPRDHLELAYGPFDPPAIAKASNDLAPISGEICGCSPAQRTRPHLHVVDDSNGPKDAA